MKAALAINLTCFLICVGGACGQVDFLIGTDKLLLVAGAGTFAWCAIQIAYHKDQF